MESNIDNIESIAVIVYTGSILNGVYTLGPLAQYWFDAKIFNDIFQLSLYNAICYKLSLIYIQNLSPKVTSSEQVICPFQSTVMAHIMAA